MRGETLNKTTFLPLHYWHQGDAASNRHNMYKVASYTMEMLLQLIT